MQNKTGIMGGTFNPIHNGHILLALNAYEQFSLDKVLVMISPNPPHKAGNDILDTEKRVDMVKLAIKNYPDILEFSDFELKRDGYIYTAETLTLLKKQNPDTEYYFIVGGDSIRDIERWYKPEIVFANAIILAAVRGDMDLSAINNQINHLKQIYNADIRVLMADNIPVSSTEIRRKTAEKESIADMVPRDVEEYILANNIYGFQKGENNNG